MVSPWSVLKQAAKTAEQHSLPRLGAALAFYSLFSLAPLLLVVGGVAGAVLEQQTVQQDIVDYATRFLGPTGTQAVRAAMRNASFAIPSGPQAVTSILAFLFGLTAAFSNLLGTLNQIWDVESPRVSLVWGYVRRRLLSLGLVLAVGIFCLLILVLGTVVSGIAAHFPWALDGFPWLSDVTNVLIWFVPLVLLFATIYRVVPDTELQWRDVLVGGSVTAVLFSLGTLVIGRYVGGSGTASAFGAASSLVLLLFWIYWSSQIFLIGAVVTHAYETVRSSPRGGEGAAPPR